MQLFIHLSGAEVRDLLSKVYKAPVHCFEPTESGFLAGFTPASSENEVSGAVESIEALLSSSSLLREPQIPADPGIMPVDDLGGVSH
jgi:hypothetical protein